MLIKSDAPEREATPPADLAIDVRGVSKAYTLYPGPAAQAADLLGLNRLIPWRRKRYPEYLALRDVDLQLARGERVAIIGRNGAGKTTLLKLISNMVAPTTGTVTVNGAVQALMQVGVGFHPDYSGLDNIRASLLYSGLDGDDMKAAEADIIDFCELGDFLSQPLKTYSLGMQARLQFACATAIKPEILIVDEILGAGDAYFSVKSNARMQKLTKSGCTLLLVSHAMAQVLQFCERAIWIDEGRVRLEGPAKHVVTQYEEFMYEETRRLRPQTANEQKEAAEPEPVEPSPPAGQSLIKQDEVPTTAGSAEATMLEATRPAVQSTPILDLDLEDNSNWTDFTKPIPSWFGSEISRLMSIDGYEIDEPNTVELGGSRWINDNRLKILYARLLDANGKPNQNFRCNDALAIEIVLEANEAGTFPCWWNALIYGDDGRPLVRHVSDRMSYKLAAGERRAARIVYPSLLLGKGSYHISVGIFRKWDPDARSSANWYEILNRSLEFRIEDDRPYDPSLFHHPARWAFRGK